MGSISVKTETSVGYAPWVSLYDVWYTEAWPGTFFPMGFTGRLSAYVVNTSYGDFGVEITFSGRVMSGGNEIAEIGSEIRLTGFYGVSLIALNEKITGVWRLGGGLSFTRHSVSYEGRQGTEIAGVDPYISAGLACRYRFSQRVFLEIGADWVHVFAAGFNAGGLVPGLVIGIDR